MNGERVGEWGTLRGAGTPFFRYEESWANSPHGRALSLSLPVTVDREVRGPAVEYYFDNLLPDSAEIRRRIRTRFKTRSSDAFDLLTAIGRDCVGAVQLLPPKEEPKGWDRVDATPLSEDQVEQTLRDVTVATPLGHTEQDEFRISLAGAQEKTALLHMAGAWFRPRQATPTTHILKLPLGIIGGFRGDFSDSVENEWLCAQVLRELDLPVADAAIARFGEQRALIVTRFDRRWIGVDAADVHRKGFKPSKATWIARLAEVFLWQARDPGRLERASSRPRRPGSRACHRKTSARPWDCRIPCATRRTAGPRSRTRSGSSPTVNIPQGTTRTSCSHNSHSGCSAQRTDTARISRSITTPAAPTA